MRFALRRRMICCLKGWGSQLWLARLTSGCRWQECSRRIVSCARTPQLVKGTLKALLRAHQFILDNKQDTIAMMLKWLPQPRDVAEHAYEIELKTLARDGLMTDAEVESLIVRLAEKKRPLDEIRDFAPARQALKELQ